MRQGQEEEDYFLGVSGYARLGLMFIYRLMPLMRQGQEEEGLLFGGVLG